MNRCRHCHADLEKVFCDLQHAPPSNSFLSEGELEGPETFFPLKVYVCETCWLVQVPEHKNSAEIFNRSYVYFSSMSKSWLAHAEAYVESISRRLNLGPRSHVIEVASNDGYLLQYFKRKAIPCLGIEPSTSTSKVAKEMGIPVVENFFGASLARELLAEGRTADLILGNNVLAHVPDINDFVSGLALLIKPGGTVTMEFPHLLRLIEQCQFDTIYHEHFSYLSFTAVRAIFAKAGLRLYDVEELPTHGGSLRIYATPEASPLPTSERCERVLDAEARAGLQSLRSYEDFQVRVDAIRDQFLQFLLTARREGKHVAGYGAAAKGNTLMNYAGVRRGLIDFVVDRAPSKIGKLLPGSHIPVVHEDVLWARKPDYVVILPWNLKDEVIEQLGGIREWGGRFVTAIPDVKVF